MTTVNRMIDNGIYAQTSVMLPYGLKAEAKSLGINITKVTREALAREVAALKQQTA